MRQERATVRASLSLSFSPFVMQDSSISKVSCNAVDAGAGVDEVDAGVDADADADDAAVDADVDADADADDAGDDGPESEGA